MRVISTYANSQLCCRNSYCNLVFLIFDSYSAIPYLIRSSLVFKVHSMQIIFITFHTSPHHPQRTKAFFIILFFISVWDETRLKYSLGQNSRSSCPSCAKLAVIKVCELHENHICHFDISI